MSAALAEVDEEMAERTPSRRSRYRAAENQDDGSAEPQTAQEANAEYNEAVAERDEDANEALEWARSLEMTSIKFLGGKVFVEFKHGLESFKAKTSAQSVGDVPVTFTEALNRIAPHVKTI